VTFQTCTEIYNKFSIFIKIVSNLPQNTNNAMLQHSKNVTRSMAWQPQVFSADSLHRAIHGGHWCVKQYLYLMPWWPLEPAADSTSCHPWWSW